MSVRNFRRAFGLPALALSALMFGFGCEGPAEKAGDKVDDANRAQADANNKQVEANNKKVEANQAIDNAVANPAGSDKDATK